ncbi:MAG: hypothetical protein LJE83_03730 [Gammaproteobacteria bacterium]|jgi:uncharacterized protein YjiS (DUF1127 family)|nr:hypothetical protein [Gammaproteobacteria bacterium]
MSKRFILDSSELSQWHTLVQEAEQDYGCQLDETMQNYLVFTLMRFAKNSQLNAKALALDYLTSHHLPDSLRSEQLRNIGDQCLLVSGLYPQSAEKRQVGVSYYVDLGRSAYYHISAMTQQGIADLYQQLAESFILLMDLLQTIRQYTAPALNPLAALELWNQTGSRAALKQISDRGIPAHPTLLKSLHNH